MVSYLKLIRANNLLMLALIQWLMHRTVIFPLAEIYGLDIAMPDKYFVLLLIATVFIAGAGNAINDYFDVRIDEINKPTRQIVGKTISRRKAMITHQIMTGIGVVCGLFISYRAGSIPLAFVFILIPGLLWFYSAAYKRQLLVGNIVVSLMAALAPFIVVLFDQSFLFRIHGNEILINGLSRQLFSWVGVFAIFAFITTLAREIVKDMEDEEGDREWESNTLPIAAGVRLTKLIVVILLAAVLASIFYILTFFNEPFALNLTRNYAIYIVVIPIAVALFLLVKAKKPTQYHTVSQLLKLIMLGGVLYAPVSYFILAKLFNIPFFSLTL